MEPKEKPVDLLSIDPMNDEKIQRLVEKYDAESRYRRLSGLPGKLVTLLLAGMSLFHLYTAGIGILPITIQRAVHLTFAIVAIGLDLIWGYTSILSLGHGVFFSLGAYSMAMYLKLGAEDLPDFMMWSGLLDLPWFWKPFEHVWFALPMAVCIPMAFALLIGFSTFRAGVKGVYFSILTQALALVFSILFIGQQPYTGGTNGITNFQDIFGFSLSDSSTTTALYLVTVVILMSVFAVSRWLVGTKTGRLLVAIRDGENRLRFLGYSPRPSRRESLSFPPDWRDLPEHSTSPR